MLTVKTPYACALYGGYEPPEVPFIRFRYPLESRRPSQTFKEPRSAPGRFHDDRSVSPRGRHGVVFHGPLPTPWRG